MKKQVVALLVVIPALLITHSAFADDLVGKSRAALQQLVAQNSAAATCKSKALAILVFPKVVKAGFVLGAQGGEGILFEHGRVNGRYRTVAASYGLQAGVQEYGYALFFDESEGSRLGKQHPRLGDRHGPKRGDCG
jgi:lipid-binding SYLF domain-containing protein